MHIPRIRSRRDAVVAARKARWKAWDLLHGNRCPPDLVFWRPNDGRRNFGDELSPLVVRYMLEKKGIDWRTRPSARLLAIGSIVQIAEDGDVLWGAGMNWNKPDSSLKFKGLDVRAVRGPLTRSLLLRRGISCPEIFGDPGLLVPQIFPYKYEPSISFSIVPNWADMHIFKKRENVISPLWPLNRVIYGILRSKLVVSSSLHGIIIAEAYGIRAQLVLSKQCNEHIGKYQDYYYSTNRTYFKIAEGLEEALDLGGSDLPCIDTYELENAFPYDLYY